MSQGKETSLELRNLIVKLKGENKSYSKIVKKSRSTVQTIYRNYVMRGNVLKSRCGRSHKLSDRDARATVRKVKKNPKISAPKLADQIATASGKYIMKLFVEFFDQAVTMAEFPERNRSSYL
ncbi:hypothetical protein TNIN_494661 [Trichonephila inaurata madagascariensis]|uniref:Tc3 transposase DNA binding domain-containing protein n=1 Tax=Trichonephila inaurata madagascariensis TaxID=2747483 RepID=A0A8X6XSX0_9ARAC|nr:hypothetical protein TNIN_494661 [Trichonephila inaurata madagascariensis]